jgi:hypothetical protein
MHFDDRLATVLRLGTGGDRAMRTQFRQLVDLLGSVPSDASGELLSLAHTRLAELNAQIGADIRAAILREPGTRLRNPRLVRWLAEGETTVAAAAMAAARLKPDDWQALIPTLPVPARALLRHRRDLPDGTRDWLARLGIHALVLPEPEQIDDVPLELGPEMELAGDEIEPESRAGIGELVRRIESFRQTRRDAAGERPVTGAPRLPLEEAEHEHHARVLQAFEFASDPGGRIAWAEDAAAPMTVGMMLLSSAPDAPARAGEATLDAMRSHLPVRDGRLVIEGAPAVAGEWRIDAAPRFLESGGFAGYQGRLRRPQRAPREAPVDRARQADLIRQLLHELRTPVNAIQGFAEVIQQQVLGPAPSEYRALAAAIAMDAARILGGFDELDRMARLETGAMTLDESGSDLAEQLDQTVQRLDGVLRPRSARIAISGAERACPVTLGPGDAAQLAWRVLGTIAGALGPGEVSDVFLRRQDGKAMALIQLPASLEEHDDLFAPVPAGGERRGVNAGMFGPAFALRLARAEAAAAGGDLVRQGELLILSLPLLTGHKANHSDGGH